MHIEILVEDSSGEKLLSALLPKFWGANGDAHTWRVHHYKGIGRIPKNLGVGNDPAKRILHELAEKIGPLLDPDHNLSPSFNKLRDGLLRLVS